MSMFPIKGDSLPKGKSGWLVFFDEFTSCPKAVQAACYKIILDKYVGMHPLHQNVAMVAAGNLETDNAIVEPMSTALQSRMVHLEMIADPEVSVDYMMKAGFDHRITSYIKFKPDMLYKFNPDHSDKTYPCNRTWEFTDKLLQNHDIDDKLLLPILAGTISEGAAREFIGFCKIYKDLPDIHQIIANPNGIPVPDEPSILFALTGSIASHTTENNVDKLMEFVHRLPVEFQVVTLREIVRRHKELIKSPAIQGWISKNAVDLF